MKEFKDLVDIMATLRSKNGCQWDMEQTHKSLLPYLIEESHEAFDALDSGNDEWACEELGDLLLQIIFYCQIASENGSYSIKDVICGLSQKLIRRHPHVFADAVVENNQQLDEQWNRIKDGEKKAKASRDEKRSLSPLLKSEIVKALCDKKGIYRKNPEQYKHIDGIEKLTPEEKEKVIGQTLLAVIKDSLEENIDPERALWNAINN